MRGESQAPRPTPVPFWLQPVSNFGLSEMTTFIESLLALTIAFTLALTRLMLAGVSLPRSLDTRLSTAATWSEGY